MGVSRIDDWPAFLVGMSDGLWIDPNGRIVLEPANFWPNQYGQDHDENGEPSEWDLSGLADPIVGFHVNVSKPGDPRRQSLARQTTTYVPTNEGSYSQDRPWVAGGMIAPSDSRTPPTPEIEAVPNNSRGWEAGIYGYAIGFGSIWGDTTASGIRYFTLAAGEFPTIPVPDGFAAGVAFINIYMTAKDKGDDTLRLQERVPVAQIRGRDIPVYGPRVDRGKPPATNKSGIGRPQRPPNRNTRTRSNTRGDTLEGIWTAAYQLYIPGMGASLVGHTGKKLRVRGDKKRVKVNDSGDVTAEDVIAYGDVTVIDSTPPGRRDDADYAYMGEEIDPSESQFVGALNGMRGADGIENNLVLNAALNRAAWRHANGEGRFELLVADEGYDDEYIGTTTKAAEPAAALDELLRYPGLRILDDWHEIGVARTERGWSIILGAGVQDVPTIATFESVNPDGSIVVCDPTAHPADGADGSGVQFADATAQLTWDCVVGDSLDYSYSGSYSAAVQHAASAIEAACDLHMNSGGSVLDITDGALPAGVAARTYSDGRMILSSSLMAGATTNAREAVTTHETGHTARLDHNTGTSVMRPAITMNSSSNINTFTADDKATLVPLWGEPGAGGGGGEPDDEESQGGKGGGGTGTGGNEIKKPRDDDERNGGGGGGDGGDGQDWHYEVRDSGVARHTVLQIRPPKILRKAGRSIGMKYTAWWFHNNGGRVTSYVVKPKKGQVGAAAFFREMLRVAGTPGGEGEEGDDKLAPGVQLIAESPPEEDETEIEAPDPTSAPDAPIIGGQEILPAGRYVATVQGVTEGGAVTRPSDLARADNLDPFIDITTTTMPKIYLPNTVNLIKNAEGGTVDKNGKPEDWTIAQGTTPAYFRTKLGGGFEIGATSSTANVVRGVNRRILISDTDSFTIAGDLGVTRLDVSGGVVRVAVKCFDEDDILLSTLIPGTLNAIGEIKFKQEYGPGAGATAWPAGLSYIVVEIQTNNGGANISVEGFVTNLRAYPYAEDIGKVALDGFFGDFDPDPALPAPSGSFVAAGLPPSPGTGTTTPAEAEPPTAYTGFETSAPGTGFTTGGSHPGTITYVSAPSAIHGSKSAKFVDTSKTTRQTSWVETTAAVLENEPAYFRGLYVVDTLPSAGRTRFHAQYDGAAFVFGVNVDKSGIIVLEYANAAGTITTKTLTTKVTVGQLIDIETVVFPGEDGLLEVYIGLGGARRTRAATVPWVLTDRSGHRCLGGMIAHTDTAARPAIRADQLVVTPRGDVANREQPTPPVGGGYTPPTIDRPFDLTVPREFDELNEPIYQLRGFIEPGTTRGGPRIIPLLDDPVNVRPGVTYTFGAYSRYTGFTGDVSELRVRMTGPGLPDVLSDPIALSGKVGWADRVETFDVPLGYMYAQPEFAGYPSFFVFQEFAMSRGTVITRGYGRATLGTGTWEIDALPDNPIIPRYLSEVGAKELLDDDEIPEPGDVVATIRTTNDRIVYLPYTDPVDQALRYYNIDVVVTGDGTNGPAISDLYARTWCPVGQVCTPEGEPINAYVGNLFTASPYPDVEPRRAGGRSANVPDSDDVAQGSPVTITAFDEDAAKLVMLLSRRATLQLNVPTAGGTSGGKSYEVRIEGGIKLVPEDGQLAGIDAFGRRDIVYKGDAEVVDVITEGTLPEPMGFIDPKFMPEPGVGGTPELIP